MLENRTDPFSNLVINLNFAEYPLCRFPVQLIGFILNAESPSHP